MIIQGRFGRLSSTYHISFKNRYDKRGNMYRNCFVIHSYRTSFGNEFDKTTQKKRKMFVSYQNKIKDRNIFNCSEMPVEPFVIVFDITIRPI